MSLNNIEDIAAYIVADGKGILAADEVIQPVEKGLILLVLSPPKRIEEITEKCFLDLKE